MYDVFACVRVRVCVCACNRLSAGLRPLTSEKDVGESRAEGRDGTRGGIVPPANLHFAQLTPAGRDGLVPMALPTGFYEPMTHLRRTLKRPWCTMTYEQVRGGGGGVPAHLPTCPACLIWPCTPRQDTCCPHVYVCACARARCSRTVGGA